MEQKQEWTVGVDKKEMTAPNGRKSYMLDESRAAVMIPGAKRNKEGKTGNKPEEGKKRHEEHSQLLEEVNRLAGTRVYISITKDLSPNGHVGFQTLASKGLIDQNRQVSAIEELKQKLFDGQFQSRSLDKELKEKEIFELIDFFPLKAPVYKDGEARDVGWFQGKKKKKERRLTGYRNVMYSEMVQGGKGDEEQAIEVVYYVPPARGWQDYSGREGQSLAVEMILPESTAKELENLLKKEPAFIRDIVEKEVKEKILGKSNSEKWEEVQGDGSSLKPPYEDWDPHCEGRGIRILD